MTEKLGERTAMNEYYVFGNHAAASADPRMLNGTVQKLWKSFCLTEGEISLSEGEACTFRMGDIPLPVLEDGCEFAAAVDHTGAAVVGRDYGGLMRGYIALLMRIEYTEPGSRSEKAEFRSAYRISKRMIHVCVFPDNDLYSIKKIVRLAGLCQYTHIVIEFWGMLKYDCLKELAWPSAFTKAQIADLIREVREFGMEPIPMFNQLGHATASRICHGKHVVLEQNPRLQNLFTPDGWAWNIGSEKVHALLKNVRTELYELFGEGEFMHIGCDEAYYYSHCDEERRRLPEFLRRLTDEVAAEGRRPMLWMDMLLERGKYPNATASCAPEEVEILQKSLNPASVMVDWQYDTTQVPVQTLMSLKDSGHDVIGAPWYRRGNYSACVNTVADHGMYGIMMTTWHALGEQMSCILGCAKVCGATTFPWGRFSPELTETATMLRRVSFEGNDYASSGWAKVDMVNFSF